MKNIWIFLISIFIIIPGYVYADSQATITMNPETPAPYESVILTITSYSFNVDTAMITWTVAGKKITSGVGVKKISVTARGGGEVIPVSAKAETASGDSIELSLQVVPQSIDLLWETPESYVPPFYEGKSLPGEGALVRVTALPSMSLGGRQIPSNNLSYSWYVNNQYRDGVSGYGRQSANLYLDYLSQKTDIKVKVQSVNGAVAEKTITIYPHEVMPLLYTYDDILGTNFTQLLTRRFETTKEVTLSLIPYYLSTNGALSSSASYTWFLDGLPVTPQEKTLLALRPKENSAGNQTLSIMVSNSKRRLQNAQTSLSLIFDTRN